MTQEQKLEQTMLVTQSFDNVTVSPGQAPVLNLNELGVQGCAVLLLNFLRSGSNLVQVSYMYDINLHGGIHLPRLHEILNKQVTSISSIANMAGTPLASKTDWIVGVTEGTPPQTTESSYAVISFWIA